MRNNYHITLETLDNEKLDVDCIAYDRSITYPNCLTIVIQSNYKVVIDLDNIKCISITAIK